jgi:hypothetical protein
VCSLGLSDCAWFFTALDHDAIDGAGIDASFDRDITMRAFRAGT